MILEEEIFKIDGFGYKYSNGNKETNRFHKNNIYVLENIELYLKLNNYKNKLLPSKYENSNSKLNFTCDMCGESFKTTFNHLRNMGQTHCKKCGKIISLEKDRFSLEYIRKYYQSKGLILIDNEYTGVKQRLTVKNKQGYMSQISYNSLKAGNNIEIFSKSNLYTIYNIGKFIEINDLDCKLLSEIYINKKAKLEFECNCGNKFYTSFDGFIKGKYRCDTCSKVQSKYELLTEKYLIKHNLKYEKEYWFNNCRDKYPLPFDFVLKDLNDNIKIIIECDGEGHYKPTKFNGILYSEAVNRFNIIKYHDTLKNTYCEDNNIPLLRIPYWEFKNDNYINILNNKLYIQV